MGGVGERVATGSLQLDNYPLPSPLPRGNATLKKNEIWNLILNSAFLAHFRMSKSIHVAGSLSPE